MHALNASAFETPAEAGLVNALWVQVQPVVSLVAEHAGSVVGHILFSPVALSGHVGLKIMGLAPMADLRTEVDKIADELHQIFLWFVDFSGEFIWKYCGSLGLTCP